MRGIISICDNEQNVFILTREDGATKGYKSGKDALESLEEGTGGGLRTPASLFIVQFDPRVHEIEDIKELIENGVCEEKPKYYRITGECGVFYGVKCNGPNAFDWHMSAVGPGPQEQYTY
jgi:hypothetical protein